MKGVRTFWNISVWYVRHASHHFRFFSRLFSMNNRNCLTAGHNKQTCHSNTLKMAASYHRFLPINTIISTDAVIDNTCELCRWIAYRWRLLISSLCCLRGGGWLYVWKIKRTQTELEHHIQVQVRPIYIQVIVFSNYRAQPAIIQETDLFIILHMQFIV